jgi:flagella basal body P-ring formation protein FlgA
MLVILGIGPPDLSAISGRSAPHFCALCPRTVPRVAGMSWRLILTVAACLLAPSWARASAWPVEWTQRLEGLAEQAARAALPAEARVDIDVGAPDPRLRLAPCQRVQPFVPAGQSLWGRSRLGLRCVEGASRWSVTIPVTVRVTAPTWVVSQPLPAGTVLAAEHLRWTPAEVSAEPGPVLGTQSPVGRTLARPMEAGEVLRQPHLRARQWFAAGDTVQVRWQGQGFAVSAEGQAMGPGLEGAPVRVRVGGGRVIQALPVAERRVEALS